MLSLVQWRAEVWW